MVYGQRAMFQKSKTKTPDETMHQHQGLAWVGAQTIIRLYRRSLEAADTPQGLQHQQDILAQAITMSTTYVEEKTVIDT
eukprot:1244130-Karenia_brevis.AAC.1